MEIEADEFAIKTFMSFDGNGLPLVNMGMTTVTAGLIAKALSAPGGVLPVRLEQLNDTILVRRSYGSHPPMLIRLLNALEVMEKEKVPNFACPNCFTRLKSQVKLIP
jgi:hypothetical protein